MISAFHRRYQRVSSCLGMSLFEVITLTFFIFRKSLSHGFDVLEKQQIGLII